MNLVAYVTLKSAESPLLVLLLILNQLNHYANRLSFCSLALGYLNRFSCLHTKEN